MKTKVVLFDASGVLFPANKVVGEDLMRRFKLSEEAMRPMWQGLYRDYGSGKVTTAEFLSTFATMYNLPAADVTEDIFTESFLRALSPMPGMEDVLKRLSQTDVTLAMLSDTTPMYAQARHDSFFSQYFDKIFLSFEIGYRKPDVEAYQAVTDYYKIPANEVFFIDDNQTNIDAALAYGMQAVVFTNAQTLTSRLEEAGILK